MIHHHAGDARIFESMKIFGEFCPIHVTMPFKTFPIRVQDTSGFIDLVSKEAPGVEIISLNPGEEYLYSK